MPLEAFGLKGNLGLSKYLHSLILANFPAWFHTEDTAKSPDLLPGSFLPSYSPSPATLVQN